MVYLFDRVGGGKLPVVNTGNSRPGKYSMEKWNILENKLNI
jgi:hypothetical protein